MLKKLLEEIKNTDYKEFEFNNWKIYSSNHSLDRNLERIRLSINVFENILKEMILFFDTCDNCLNSEYLIYSKKFEQGLIIDLFKDVKKKKK